MKKTVLSLVVVVGLGGVLASCRWHGECITEKVVEDRVLPVEEFKRLFAEEKLFSECFWYFGQREGYSYVEIDEARSIDQYDDDFNRRVHHTLRRYRVSEAEVVFTPARPFLGYTEGRRIVAPRFADENSVVYEVRGGNKR